MADKPPIGARGKLNGKTVEWDGSGWLEVSAAPMPTGEPGARMVPHGSGMRPATEREFQRLMSPLYPMGSHNALGAAMKLAQGDDAREELTGLAGEAALMALPGVAGAAARTPWGQAVKTFVGPAAAEAAAAARNLAGGAKTFAGGMIRNIPGVGPMLEGGHAAIIEKRAAGVAAKRIAEELAAEQALASQAAPTATKAAAVVPEAVRAAEAAPARVVGSELEARLAASLQGAPPAMHPSVVLSQTLQAASKNPTPEAARAVDGAFRAAVGAWKAQGYSKEKIVQILQRTDFGQTKAAAKKAVDAVF